MSDVYPFQKLVVLHPKGQLLAAAGPELFCIDLRRKEFEEDEDEEHIKLNWRHSAAFLNGRELQATEKKIDPVDASEHAANAGAIDKDEPAAKRRKLDDPGESSIVQDQDTSAASQQEDLSRRSSQDSISITTDPRKKGERRKQKPPPSLDQPAANISHMLLSFNRTSLVVVTAEDKAITVYAMKKTADEEVRGLRIMSRRIMPKRICAVAVVKKRNREFLIVGDKFGDVWEVPLIQSPDWKPPDPQPDPSHNNQDLGSNGSGGKGGYEPSATELTVHTKGNLMALEQQRKLKEKKAKERASHGIDQGNARKNEASVTGKGPGIEFEARLLLGHVSLLTDVIVARMPTFDYEGGPAKNYVLSSDRDEHIREFVSCQRLLPWKLEWLAVGTGEPSLRIFDWRKGKSLSSQTFDVFEIESKFMRSVACPGHERSLKAALKDLAERQDKFAVRGIWPLNDPDEMDGYVLVALEGLPLLLVYHVSLSDGALELQQTVPLSGNILDVAVDNPLDTGTGRTYIFVSLDTAHVPGSMLEPATPATAKSMKVLDHANETLGTGVQILYMKSPGSDSPDGKRDQYLRECYMTDKLSALLRGIEGRPTMNLADSNGKPATGEEGGQGRGGRKGPYSQMGEFLYGLENLRKKRGAAAAEEDPEGEDAGGEAQEMAVEGAPEVPAAEPTG
ncbi:tRNA (guanine-N(7)-)-methyltransferase non-catalytic subunit trm82 [Cyphellophora attinorum]|uniref:tRNA (Guanine-N(7)-)-methyltransferase non-catalytic subunit trm82 n=1 Tax=Cyphellophora attinorum TaxID=1664694 RepID=A0A0N1HEI9_9EURO|nr:tRNA (guanine-N(7)-)-methyltransferase non-catalytic subunit trm82 [Phialophora attinorum]KPI43424.1 tRNA (guanine-N(7)-)-methyltransferase non-catalytic subunit trm82 [Phialophora attinorum]